MAERIAVAMDEHGIEWDSRPSYEDFVRTFGDILASASSSDWQGDSLYLIQGARYGVLTFGWGSCSGCDALEACRTQEDLNDLQDDLERGIKWFDSISDVDSYLASGQMDNLYLSADVVAKFKSAVKVAAAA